MSPVCPNCHQPALPEDHFCAHCGETLKSTPRPLRPQHDFDMEFHPLPLTSVPYDPEPRRPRRWMQALRIAIAGLILAGGVAGASFLMDEDEDAPQETAVSIEASGASPFRNTMSLTTAGQVGREALQHIPQEVGPGALTTHGATAQTALVAGLQPRIGMLGHASSLTLPVLLELQSVEPEPTVEIDAAPTSAVTLTADGTSGAPYYPGS